MGSASRNTKIGIILCSALVIGNVIGSGIFLLPASLAPYGGMALLGWCATGLGAFMTALVFGRLSQRTPKQGGPYAYAHQQMGPLAGFIVAWSYWVSLWAGNAAIAVAMVTYSSYFIPELESIPFLGMAVALSAIILLTLVNLHGFKTAARLQLLTTILKLAPLLLIGAACFAFADSSSFVPLNPTELEFGDALATTAALTLWAFLGIESATIPADNVKQPQKTIPRATLLSFIIIALVYLTGTITIMSVLPTEVIANSNAPFADAAKIMWGDWAGYLVAAGAIISCFGALNGWILIQGQLGYSVAKDGLFPRSFAKLSDKGVPATAIAVSCVFIAALTIANFSRSLVNMFTFAILLSTLAILLPYLFSVICELKHLWQHKHKSLQAVTAWLSTLLALIFVLWAITGIGAEALIWGFVLISAGLPLYWWLGRQNQTTAKLAEDGSVW